MVVSLHSHSGEFCLHAVGELEQVVKSAISGGFLVYGLSEHMPRYRSEDLYPEEVNNITPADTITSFLKFLEKATLLKEKYSQNIRIKVGMETEWIYEETPKQIQYLLENHPIEYIIGSVHHVDGIPIDYNESFVLKAENALILKYNNDQGTELLFREYFNAQYDMIQTLKPQIIGHFDLIRLFRPDYPLSKSVWDLINRNIKLIKSYDGIVELNSRSLKKKLPYSYPFRDILQVMISENVKFTISDDSHGPMEVGLHYKELYKILLENNITSIWIPRIDKGFEELQVIDNWNKLMLSG